MTGVLAAQPTASASSARPIQPLRSWPDGCYQDELVTVRRVSGDGPPIEVRVQDGRTALRHRLHADELDDEMAADLAAALAPLTSEHDIFARAFTGLVVTTDRYAAAAWLRFYDNTLALLGDPSTPGYTAVYRHALDLLPTTSVLDLGCSFGFLSLHLAARGTATIACDIDPGTTGLLRCMARMLRRPVDVRDDIAAVDDRCVDGVALLHVLEHVDEVTGRRLLDQALRVARRRVVVAVPFEDRPDPLFGHVRSLGLANLRQLGAASGWRYSVTEHVGGWLVLDRPEREK